MRWYSIYLSWMFSFLTDEECQNAVSAPAPQVATQPAVRFLCAFDKHVEVGSYYKVMNNTFMLLLPQTCIMSTVLHNRLEAVWFCAVGLTLDGLGGWHDYVVQGIFPFSLLVEWIILFLLFQLDDETPLLLIKSVSVDGQATCIEVKDGALKDVKNVSSALLTPTFKFNTNKLRKGDRQKVTSFKRWV